MKKIAVLGPKGTFSDLASQKYMQETLFEPVYFPSIDATIEGLDETDFAVVPIENTLDGYVQQTLDLILAKKVFVLDEIYVPVQFSLIAYCDGIDGIKRIYAQFITKGQCQKLLKTLPHAKLIITDSNMESYQMLMNGSLGDAAIIPSHMVDSFDGFKLQNVTDSSENYTRFFILGKQSIKKVGDDMKVSIVVVPIHDRPGLLYDILGIFKKYDINLISIMSRPTKTTMGNYNFFIEMKAQITDQIKIDHALTEIKKDFFIQTLGIYPARK